MNKIKSIINSKRGSVPVVIPYILGIIIGIIGLVYGLIIYFA